MKKLLSLLTLLLCVCSGAWADTMIYSWEGAQGGATETGGFIKSYATDGGDETTDDINQNNGANNFWYIRLRGANNFSTNVVKITLNSALAAGDHIKVTGYRNKNTTGKTSGFKAKFDKGSSTVGSSSGLEYINIDPASGDEYSETPNTCTFDVPNDAAGSSVITMTRSHTSTNFFVTKIEIVRAEATVPTITTQPVSASYKQDATAAALSVAATASAGSLSYQWYSNTTQSTEGATAINGATSEEYTPSTASEGTTYFYCVVTDGNGSTASDIVAIKISNASTAVVGYTEAINGNTLDARVLTGADNITISAPIFGSNITDYKGTSKAVIIDGTTYNNTDSWRKSQNGPYDGQNVGYTLSVASGYKMNISHVSARIAVADDTYNWYVEILNGAGTQVWKSGEKTSKKTGTSGVVDADVTEKVAIQGMTGDVTVNLYVKQGGSTKYFSINYLQLTVETEVDVRPTYAMSVSSNDETMGTVTPADDSSVTEGESVAFTATPNTEYRFVKWVIDGVDQTANPYIIENVNAAHTAVAQFAKRYTVSYDLGEYAGTLTGRVLCNVKRGNGIDEVYSDDADNYTIPTYADKYLYREGYIFDQWQDGDGNTYASGDVIAMTKDITLTPTWKTTSNALSASGNQNVVTWNFAKANIVFVDWQSNDKYGFYTQTATVDGEAIAVPMSIVNGKTANYTRTDAIAQTNPNTTFTIPAVNGMVVEIVNAYKELSTTTIAGSTEYAGTGTKSISYTYTGSDATIDIVIGEENQYLSTIKVTYPKTYTFVDVTEVGYRTFASSSALDFTGGIEGLTAYSASIENNVVNFKPIDGPVPAGEGMLIKAAAGRYYIPVATSAPAAIENEFVGVTSKTTVEGAGIFVLMNVYDVIGFYKTTAESFEVGANTAYLPADVMAEARAFISLDGEEATGIAEVKGIAAEQEVYDLQGRRVAQPVKGLYIVNGRKVVVK